MFVFGCCFILWERAGFVVIAGCFRFGRGVWYARVGLVGRVVFSLVRFKFVCILGSFG